MRGPEDISRRMSEDIDRRPDPRGVAATIAAKAAIEDFGAQMDEIQQGWGGGNTTRQDRPTQQPAVAHSRDIMDFEG